MSAFLTLVVILLSGSAQAQFPYNYAPSTPRYPPTAYAPPTEDRSSASIAQGTLDAHNAIRARVGVPPPSGRINSFKWHKIGPSI